MVCIGLKYIESLDLEDCLPRRVVTSVYATYTGAPGFTPV